MTNRYYKRRWEESRGDDHDEWGPSTWYFEVADDGYAVRQIENYDQGPTLRYSRDADEDQYGGLSYAKFEEGDWPEWEVSREEFETAWDSTT